MTPIFLKIASINSKIAGKLFLATEKSDTIVVYKACIFDCIFYFNYIMHNL